MKKKNLFEHIHVLAAWSTNISNSIELNKICNHQFSDLEASDIFLICMHIILFDIHIIYALKFKQNFPAE